MSGTAMGAARRAASALPLVAALLALFAASLPAQVRPDARWRTIATPHFRVHFEPSLDSLAYRTAESAERAWARLSAELAPPRGPLDIVVGDNVDYSNGYATPFPTNRIVIYAAAPADAGALRQYADWVDLVVSHELVHIFHLDRVRGWWRAGQYVFGRNPLLFPAVYAPSWLTEGLAVYYETRLTGSGRLAGTSHRAFAHAAAIGGGTPRIDQLSSVTPAFPGGNVSYVYGSLLVEQLAARRPDALRRFVDHYAGEAVPMRLDHAARVAFGRSFRDAWRTWRDSVSRTDAGAAASTRPELWNVLTREGWFVESPRWRADGSALLYAASGGRTVPGAFEARPVEGEPARRISRVGRRNSLDANVPTPDGGILFAQLEFDGLYTVRSDLWVQHGARTRRLTRGARLGSPDVRADGGIVAVQVVPGTTRLVRLDADGGALRAITLAHADTQWAEPRWSPDGSRIAAVRRARGGRSSIVVLDADGGAAREVAASDGVEASPTWSPDGASLLFTSDRRGRAELFAVRVEEPGAPLALLANGRARSAGVFWPDLARTTSGSSLAAVTLEADGFHLVVGDVETARDTVAAVDAPRDAPRRALADTAGAEAIARARRATPTTYRATRSLLPRYWVPLLSESDVGDLVLGFATSGADIVGRHSYGLELSTPPASPEELEGNLSWRWAGLGQPLVDLWTSQSWEHLPVAIRDTVVGTVRRSSRVGALGLAWVRPRIYSSASLSVGGDVEQLGRYALTERAFPTLRISTRPTALLPGAYLSFGASALQRAPLGVSVEDGVGIAARLRQQWQGDLGRSPGRTAVGTLRGYRSFDLPGYARHVLAVRASAGIANAAAEDYFSGGGTSGGAIELLPGYVVGDVTRTFGVRGFPAGTIHGSRALGGTVEWRAPLALAGRGIGLVPLFLSRTGVNVFAEAAKTWCGAGATSAPCFGIPEPSSVIGSAGAELFADAALGFDALYRIRGGIALPRSRSLTVRDRAVLYLTFGTAF